MSVCVECVGRPVAPSDTASEPPWETRKVCSRRSLRYVRRAVAAERLPDFRVSSCGRPIGSGDLLVSVGDGGDGKRLAAFEGHETCSSAWVCPVCSSKIRARRGAEVHQGLEKWFSEDGHSAMLVTVTVRHHMGDPLDGLLRGMASAWRKLVGSRRYRKFCEANGVIGYIRALEITYGRNGWHPHHHMLLLVDGVVNEAVAEALRRLLLQLWSSAVEHEGLGVPNEHAVDVKPIGRDWQRVAADYVTKIVEGFSAEVTGSENKSARDGNIVPFQLLDDDDPESVRAWREYAEATKGRRCIWWSRGLRDKLGLGVEATDDEVMNTEERGGVHREALIDRDSYKRVLREDPSRLAEVLQAVEASDFPRAARLLGCGLRVETMWLRSRNDGGKFRNKDDPYIYECVTLAVMRPEYGGVEATVAELGSVGSVINQSVRF